MAHVIIPLTRASSAGVILLLLLSTKLWSTVIKVFIIDPLCVYIIYTLDYNNMFNDGFAGCLVIDEEIPCDATEVLLRGLRAGGNLHHAGSYRREPPRHRLMQQHLDSSSKSSSVSKSSLEEASSLNRHLLKGASVNCNEEHHHHGGPAITSSDQYPSQAINSELVRSNSCVIFAENERNERRSDATVDVGPNNRRTLMLNEGAGRQSPSNDHGRKYLLLLDSPPETARRVNNKGATIIGHGGTDAELLSSSRRLAVEDKGTTTKDEEETSGNKRVASDVAVTPEVDKHASSTCQQLKVSVDKVVVDRRSGMEIIIPLKHKQLGDLSPDFGFVDGNNSPSSLDNDRCPLRYSELAVSIGNHKNDEANRCRRMSDDDAEGSSDDSDSSADEDSLQDDAIFRSASFSRIPCTNV